MNVVLYGFGGHGKVVLDTVLLNNIRWDHIVLVDDDYERKIEPFKFRGPHDAMAFLDPLTHRFIISIGDNKTRRWLALTAADRGFGFYSAIHPNAVIARDTLFGDGVAVMPNAVINAGTEVKDHAIINTVASVDHDCVIGAYSHIAPGSTLCGAVQVGEGALIGAGSVCLPKTKIGKGSVIGAGSVVVSDIPDGVIAFGNPCKVVREVLWP